MWTRNCLISELQSIKVYIYDPFHFLDEILEIIPKYPSAWIQATCSLFQWGLNTLQNSWLLHLDVIGVLCVCVLFILLCLWDSLSTQINVFAKMCYGLTDGDALIIFGIINNLEMKHCQIHVDRFFFFSSFFSCTFFSTLLKFYRLSLFVKSYIIYIWERAYKKILVESHCFVNKPGYLCGITEYNQVQRGYAMLWSGVAPSSVNNNLKPATSATVELCFMNIKTIRDDGGS